MLRLDINSDGIERLNTDTIISLGTVCIVLLNESNLLSCAMTYVEENSGKCRYRLQVTTLLREMDLARETDIPSSDAVQNLKAQVYLDQFSKILELNLTSTMA